MILKNESTQLVIDVKKSQSNDGLCSGDYWCCVDILVKNSNIDLKTSKELLSKLELDDLIIKMKRFLENDFTQKMRISFIKNYFVIYLESNSKGRKSMRIKLIHIDSDQNNYVLFFDDNEIKEFLHLLENFQINIE